jgi:thiamine-phosphate pyrophosphorylase
LGLLLPRLYVILDAGLMREPAAEFARKLIGAGVELLQYRAKNVPAREMLARARELAAVARGAGARFFVNDRPDVAYLAEAHGVHVGQDDLGVEEARVVVGPDAWVGLSTHNIEQFEKATRSSADYIAVGPIFVTTSKVNPDPVVGLHLIRHVRRLTERPIVAIGGITLESAAEVIEAGADSVAVIGDILQVDDPVGRATEYLRRLEAAGPRHNH